VAQRHERDVVRVPREGGRNVDRQRTLNRVAFEPVDRESALSDEAFEDVSVGWKVRPIGDDGTALRPSIERGECDL
jgi:hypothetical protein